MSSMPIFIINPLAREVSLNKFYPRKHGMMPINSSIQDRDLDPFTVVLALVCSHCRHSPSHFGRIVGIRVSLYYSRGFQQLEG